MQKVTELNNRKYATKSLIKRFLLDRFIAKVAGYIGGCKANSILDYGCGSAAFWEEMYGRLSHWPDCVIGIDLDEDAIRQAKGRDIKNAEFFPVNESQNITSSRRFNCIICVEVLEHLENPEEILKKLCDLQPQSIILSVPNEPWFRICQMLSLKNLSRFGNDIDHVQNWSAAKFTNMVKGYLDITSVDISAFPFTIVVGKPKKL